MKPSEFQAWSTRDRGLAEALLLHEESMCGGCGHPIGTAWDADADGWWTATEVVCVACAAVDRYQNDQQDPTPGGRVRAHLDLQGWRDAQARRAASRPKGGTDQAG